MAISPVFDLLESCFCSNCRLVASEEEEAVEGVLVPSADPVGVVTVVELLL